MADKSLLCRLGMHQWFLDCAYFTHARCCDRCGVYQDPRQAKHLLRERDLWEAVPRGTPFKDAIAEVAINLSRTDE